MAGLGVVGPGVNVIGRYQGPRWLRGWAQWDSGWSATIADHGYDYVPGRQSTAAFFPAYPMLVRAVSVVVVGAFVAGFVVTLASGAAAAPSSSGGPESGSRRRRSGPAC